MRTDNPSNLVNPAGEPVSANKAVESYNAKKERLAREAVEKRIQAEESKPLNNTRPLKARMLSSRILVLPAEAASFTANGLAIPDEAKKNPPYGVVVSVGEGWRDTDNPSKLTKLSIKKGETVMYGQHTGTEIVINGNLYLHMRAEDVIAVIEEDLDAQIIDNRPDKKYDSVNEIPLANGEVDPLAEQDAVYEDECENSILDYTEDTLG